MRPTRFISGLILSCVVAAPISAQSVPYTAIVTQADAEVRCKPGATPAVYVTKRLNKGDAVLVVEERQDGWLGVAPPPGSFSWINTRFVTQIVATQSNWMVNTDPTTKAPVLIGSEINNQRPTVEGVHLDRGAQVHAIGAILQDREGYWLPIDPPAGEVRYIRADVVKKPQPVLTSAAPAAASREPERTPLSPAAAMPAAYSTFVPTPPPSGPAAATTAPAVPESLWSRAAQAERNGQITEAIQIYRQLYRDNIATNPEAADWANKRATFLQNGQPAAPTVTVSVIPAAPAPGSSPAQPQPKFVPLQTQQLPPPVQPASRGGFANPTSGEKTSAQLASRTDPTPDDRPPSARLNPPTVEATSPSTSTTNQAMTPGVPGTQKVYSSGPGKLVRAARQVSGQPTYRLLTSQGNPTLYATAAPGLDLELFVDKNVELIGTAQYVGEMRANHMQVLQVQPLPPTP